jgi:hypothetical protein
LFGEFANLLLNQISLASSWDLLANGSEDGIASVRAETETLVQTSADRLAGAAIDPISTKFRITDLMRTAHPDGTRLDVLRNPIEFAPSPTEFASALKRCTLGKAPFQAIRLGTVRGVSL